MELGGCCLTRYGSVAVLPSKADRIMSRYRPIAPKPVPLSMPPPIVPESDRTVSSVVCSSFDTSGCRQVPDSSKSRRARKRRGESLASPRGSKKAACSKSDSNRERSSVSNGTAGSVAERTLGSQIAPFSRPFGVKGMSRCVSMETQESSEASVLGGGAATVAAAAAAAAGAGISCGIMESTRMMEQDAGFMERAAASAPPSVLPERKIATKASGGFTEMIRGITGLATAADVHSLMHPFRAPAEATPSSCAEVGRDGFAIASAPAFSPNAGCEIAVGRDEERQDDGRSAKLVTLPLLPDTPSRADSPSDSSVTTCSSLGHAADFVNCFGEGSKPARLSFLGDETRLGSSGNSFLQGPLCDIACIEQTYGSSREPAVLVDDSSRSILWLNRAYEKALKDTLDRQAGKTSPVVPFIDPLGIPTQLRRFPGCRGCSSVTLWGFLKKFVVDTAAEGSAPSFPEGFPLKESINGSPDTFPRLGEGSYASTGKRAMLQQGFQSLGATDCEPGRKSSVIVPLPMRLVGSTVSLESVTEIQTEVAPLSESLDQVKKQLEEGSLPAFITDSSSLVRWVNTAYKQMVGQPECSWLVCTVGGTSASSSSSQQSPRLTGEVLLTFNVEVPISAPAFSGRANIQWTNTGERNCMTVPCDVSRLDCLCSGKAMLIWKFDIDASLRLTCGAREQE